MTGYSDMELLQSKGDPLEILICQDFAELSAVILPYARLWAQHIYPRRVGNGAMLVDEWLHFGGCHYTALVRLHHALIAKRSILTICEKAGQAKHGKATAEDYARLLDIHAACAAFWDNLGASIDNFFHAKEEAKKILGVKAEKRKERPPCPKCGSQPEASEKFIARTVSQATNPQLYYAFERRHQFIHSILVPAGLEAGMIVFNLRHYDDAATTWSKDLEVMQNIDSQIQQDWHKVINEFANAWEGFSSWMRVEDKDRPKQETREATPANVAGHKGTIYGTQFPANPNLTFTIPPSGSKS